MYMYTHSYLNSHRPNDTNLHQLTILAQTKLSIGPEMVLISGVYMGDMSSMS